MKTQQDHGCLSLLSWHQVSLIFGRRASWFYDVLRLQERREYELGSIVNWYKVLNFMNLRHGLVFTIPTRLVINVSHTENAKWTRMISCCCYVMVGNFGWTLLSPTINWLVDMQKWSRAARTDYHFVMLPNILRTCYTASLDSLKPKPK